jgi:RecB family exonuclease
MPHFLKQVAREICRQHASLKEVGLILPSRRAALFLKKELAATLQKPDWSPQITTIEDFVMESQGLVQEEQARLIFLLFEAYQASSLPKKDNFADFNKWAHLLLADFNEVDRYLVNAKQLFSYLADVKRIERWNLKPEEETDMLKHYLSFWEGLPDLYLHYTAQLLGEKKVYQGLAYREVVKDLDAVVEQVKARYSKLYFIGFNALNTAEEKLLLRLYEEGLAGFYWDVDAYYFRDERHEAGRFLRKSKLVQKLQERNAFHWVGDRLSTEPKKINIYAAPGNHMQALAVNACLSDIPSQEWQQTAVVLADEQLLVPFLNNLNSAVEHLNITMGLPLRNSPLASFFQLLWEMLIGQETRKNPEPRFYHMLWDKLLSSPHLKQVAPQPEALDHVRDAIRTRKEVYLSLQRVQSLELPAELYALFQPLLAQEHQPASAMKALSNICLELKKHLESEQQFLQSLYAFYKLFNSLHELFEAHHYVEDFKTAKQFYQQLLQTETLDLYGEPLQGLQLMGMLETRTLEFKRIILSSVNEDILPSGRSQNSLIPFDIKREFELPTYLEKDSVYAYHFYRLLQGADDITLIYNSQLDNLGGGEASRFIAQLEFELQKTNPHISLQHTVLETQVSLEVNTHRIEKSHATLERLTEMAGKGFSPTSLSIYISDPIKFYYDKVLRIDEARDLEEVIGFDTEGNVVHEILEELYRKEEKDKPVALSEALLESYLAPGFLEEQVMQKLHEQGIEDLSSGKNLLTRKMLTGMLQNFFAAEKAHLQQKATLLYLEHPLKTSLSTPLRLDIQLLGNADRIDRVDGVVRVLDYKTGGVDDKKLSVKELNQLLKPEYAKAFQLCMYAYMFLKTHPEEEAVSSGIISLRMAKKWILPLRIHGKTSIGRDFIPAFESFMHTLMAELFDPSIPFASREVLILEHDDDTY